MNLPVFGLKVEHKKPSTKKDLSEYVIQMDEMLHNSIDNFCTPENLERIIKEETYRTLEIIIREEVRIWFLCGSGHEVIKKQLNRTLIADKIMEAINGMGMGE